MSNEAPPPSYDKVTSEAPPNPAPGHDTNHLQPSSAGNTLSRSVSATSDTGGDPFEGLSPDEQREFADEYRDLPEGWVKCWDPKNKHHFYVEEKTERAIWTHPYDDPEYIQSLPDTHPANPESQAARERREEIERAQIKANKRAGRAGDISGTDTDEEGPGMSSRAAMLNDSEDKDKGFIQRQKDKWSDHKERRAQRKAEERKQRAEQEKQIRVRLPSLPHRHQLTMVGSSRGVQEEEGRTHAGPVRCAGHGYIYTICRSIHCLQIANGSRPKLRLR
jgi:hypothetical protein